MSRISLNRHLRDGGCREPWHVGRHPRRLRARCIEPGRGDADVTGVPLVLPVMGRLRSWVAPLAVLRIFGTVAALAQPSTGGGPIDYDRGPLDGDRRLPRLDRLEVDCFDSDAANIIDQIATYPSTTAT